ncbi:MAG: ATP-binding cassette domain-containing protein [Alphaproteobacteria bacterium]|jgi:osmoprotectant transport system ATP-binding protein
MIRIEQVSKHFGADTWALKNVSLEIADGEFAVLAGGSGSGKSTLLSLINRLNEPTAGSIYVGGKSISAADPVQLRRRIGFVFQGLGLFPHMTVAENVGITPRLLGWPAAEIAARASDLLTLVGLNPSVYGVRLPHQLSGGQQQRVALARALAAQPVIMLLDEPFGGLDPITREQLGAEYRRIHDTLRLTTLLVTHDMTEALLLADKLAIMRAGEVVQVGTPRQVVERPADSFVRSMVESPYRRALDLSRAINIDANGH